MPLTAERKAGLILAAIAFSEGAWLAAMLLLNGSRFFRYAGFINGRSTWPSWLLAFAVAALFVFVSLRLPSVRQNLLRPSLLKLLAFAVAIAAGFCEETVFRKMLMDYAMRTGFGGAMQVAISAALFGAAHGIWGAFRGSLRTALGATIATGALGDGARVGLPGGTTLACTVYCLTFLHQLAH